VFQNYILVAMPELDETFFAKSVVLICEHNENGAIGLIINRPFDFPLSFVFDELGFTPLKPEIGEQDVLFGGPLQQERGFVIHKPYKNMSESLSLNDDILISTKASTLQSLATGKGPHDALVVLGFCGWEPNQLDEEIKANLWLPLEASSEIVYNEPFVSRWLQAGKLLGVDLSLMSQDVGHG
jgi:putative transcriptional regulator